MRRAGAVTAVIALAGLLCFLALWREDTSGPPAPDESAPSSRQKGSTGEMAADPPGGRTVVEDSRHIAGPGEAMIFGRCVAAESREPLSEVSVRLRDRPLDSPRDESWEDLLVDTGEDGRFELRFSPPEGYGYSLRLRPMERGGLTADLEPMEPGTVLDLGDITFPVLISLDAVVLDHTGAALSGVSVRLSLEDDVGETLLSSPRAISRESGADGKITFRRLHPGTWSLGIDPPFDLVSPRNLVLTATNRKPTVTVLVDATRVTSISGRVVDEEGDPLPNILISAQGQSFSIWDRSDRDGNFHIRAKGNPEEPVFLWHQTGFGLVDGGKSYRWGDSDVLLVLESPKTGDVELLVVEAATGDPVEEYSVRCFVDPMESGGAVLGSLGPKHGGTHPGGRLMLEGVRNGNNFLIVIPAGNGLLPSKPWRFEKTDEGPSQLHVELHRPIELPVHVLRSDGRPVSGSRVELIQAVPGVSSFGVPPLSVDSRAATSAGIYDAEGFTDIWLMAQGETNEDGVVVLDAPPSQEPTAVRALGPGHAPAIQTGVTISSSTPPIQLVVQAGAELRGTIRGLESLSLLRTPQGWAAYFLLTEVAGRSRHFPPAGQSWMPADDGSFHLSDVPAGTWQLGFFGQIDGPPHDIHRFRLATVKLQDGVTTEVDLDASRFRPGSLHGTVRFNGRPLVQGTIQLSRGWQNPDATIESTWTSAATTDLEGRFEFSPVYPSHYSISAVFPVEKGRVTLVLRHWTTFSPGQEVEAAFNMTAPRSELRILQADGSPAMNRSCRIQASDESGSAIATTDDEGTIVLEPSPSGTLTIRISPRPGEQSSEVQLGPIQVPPGTGAHTFELRLPPGRR